MQKISIMSVILLIQLFNLSPLLAADVGVEACQVALSKSMYQQAMQAAEKSPQSPNAWLCKGRAQAALQQWPQAQQSFEQAIQLKPTGIDLISAYLLLGNIQQAQHQTATALQSYQQAIELSQQAKINRYMRVAYNLQGEALLGDKQAAAALQAFQAGEKLAMNDNERADSYAHEAQAYEAMQQLDKAIEYQLKTVLMQQKSGTPDQYAEASLTLGQLFQAQKDYASAEKTYQRLLQYAIDHGGSFYEAKTAIYLAQLKGAQGDAASAQKWLQQADSIAKQLKDAELDALLAKNQ